jgi:vancomycin resistance protein YoaR
MDHMDALSPGAGQPAVATRRGPLRRLGSWYRRHIWVATALLIAVVAVAGFAALQTVTWGKAGDGVSVAGVSVGGLDEAAVAAAVRDRVAPRVATVRLDAGGEEPIALTLDQLGILIDAEATAGKALAAGRRDLPLGISVWLPGGSSDVPPVVRVDGTAYKKGLAVVREQVDVPAKDARLKLAGEELAVVAAQQGREVDAVALERKILAAVAAGRSYAGPVPTSVVEPEVSTVDAEARASAAATYLARPVTLRYRSKEVTLTPEQMAGMLSVNKGGDADQYPLTFHNDRAAAELHRIFAFAETPPVDATVEVNDNGTVNVTESKSGMVLDMPVLMDELDDAATGGGLRTIFVALTPAFPELSTADVQNMGLSALGSQFVTYFDPRNTSRATNIALAAKLVDGAVVEPGETFSLNAAMGPRTANRGFDYAPVIAADNVLRQGVGGGICQYATTLFNAVFFAGLPVAERRPHSLYISHYPTGRDATVAWGAIDFKFRNDTAKAIMIRSWIDGGALTVALVGKTGRTVAYKTSDFYDTRKPAHGKADPRVIYDSDLGPGVIRWEKGIDGQSVKVERTVKDAAGKVLFRDTFVSHYDPMDWVKRVGT